MSLKKWVWVSVFMAAGALFAGHPIEEPYSYIRYGADFRMGRFNGVSNMFEFRPARLKWHPSDRWEFEASHSLAFASHALDTSDTLRFYRARTTVFAAYRYSNGIKWFAESSFGEPVTSRTLPGLQTGTFHSVGMSYELTHVFFY